MDLSIIIPTYNRKEVLGLTIDSLLNQEYPKDKYEILIIDDGSLDDTEAYVNKIQDSFTLPLLRYFRQQHRGANAARNCGIKEARGEILLFLGDDQIASPVLLKEHMAYHKRYEGVGVRGDVRPYPGFSGPFQDFINEFHRRDFRVWTRTRDDVRFIPSFTTANSSISRELIHKVGLFDETLTRFWQDDEFSMRLRRAKIKVKFNSRAIVYHYHHYDFPAFYERARAVGEDAVYLARKYPRLKMISGINPFTFLIDFIFFPCPSFLKFWEEIVLAVEKRGLNFFSYLIRSNIVNHYFVQGLRDGMRKIKKNAGG